MPGGASRCLRSCRYFFCCFLNWTDSFCSSMASVRCTFCFTCALRLSSVLCLCRALCEHKSTCLSLLERGT